MTHLILTLNATAFLSAAILAVVLGLLYKKYKHALIKSYSVFHLVLSLEVFYFIIKAYLSVIGMKHFMLLSHFSTVIDAALIIAIPYFFTQLIDLKNKKQVNRFFSVLAAIFLILKYAGGILVYTQLISLSFYLNVIVGGVDFLILSPILYVSYTIISTISKNDLSAQIKSALLRALILILVFLPGFIVDIGWFHFKQKYDLLPTGFYFTSLFFIIWNTLILYGISGYLVSSRISKELFQNRCQEFSLTEREQDIASLLLNGMSNQEISTQLFIEESTVKKHLQNIFNKTSVKSRFQLSQLLSQ